MNPLISQRAWHEEPVNGYRPSQFGRPATWSKQQSSSYNYVPRGGRAMQPQIMDVAQVQVQGEHDNHDYENWEHYYAHRDRRDLYQRMETVLRYFFCSRYI